MIESAVLRGREEALRETRAAGSDERTFLDYVLKVVYSKYCSHEGGLCEWVRSRIESALSDKGVAVPWLVLGETPPTLLKTTPFRVDRPYEAYLDLTLKWYADARGRIAVTSQGATVGVEVSRASLEATLRVGCKFVDGYPWAGSLSFSFVGPTRVDFDVSVLGGVTLPLDLRRIASDAVSSRMTWPDTVDVPLAEWLGEDDTPEAMPCGILRVDVVEARDLQDSHSRRNPYVRVDYGPAARRTSIRRRTTQPQFDETFYFLVRQPTLRPRFRVYDHDSWSRNDLVGDAARDVSSLVLREASDFDEWLDLKRTGQLHVRLEYAALAAPSTTESNGSPATVRVGLLEAVELPPPKKGRRARSARLVASLGAGRYRTRVVRHSNHPRWDEYAEFVAGDAAEAVLLVRVVDVSGDLGDVAVPLPRLASDAWYPLRNAKSGRVRLLIAPRCLDATPEALDRFWTRTPRNDDAGNVVDVRREAQTGPHGAAWLETARLHPTAALWQPDELAAHCSRCSAQFTLVKRRHHCRVCLRIFCYGCCERRVNIPLFGNDRPLRICVNCYAAAASRAPRLRTRLSQQEDLVFATAEDDDA